MLGILSDAFLPSMRKESVCSSLCLYIRWPFCFVCLPCMLSYPLGLSERWWWRLSSCPLVVLEAIGLSVGDVVVPFLHGFVAVQLLHSRICGGACPSNKFHKKIER